MPGTKQPLNRRSRSARILVCSNLLVALIFGLVGCSATLKPTYVSGTPDATAAFLRHPEFADAARAAPNLLSDMLQTVTRYEAIIASREK